MADLVQNEPRFCVYDYQYKTKDNPPMNAEKLVFIYWSPDTAPAALKLVSATTKEDFKKKLTGVYCDVQAVDRSDVIYYYLA